MTDSASDWDFYFSHVDDALSSIFVDLSAIRRAPDSAKPWLLWVWVKLQSPREDGLSSGEEAPKLYEIEDALTAGPLARSGAELLGRITGNGRREFYFYSPDERSLEPAALEVRQAFPDYDFASGAQSDPEWSQYRDLLYPSEVDMQGIQNRRVLDQLEKRGDVHSIPRPVDHSIRFQNAENRRAYAAAAVRLGFTVQDELDDVGNGEDWPYNLVLIRTDPVVLNHLNGVTGQLLELAEQHDADYDGWGCEVQSS